MTIAKGFGINAYDFDAWRPGMEAALAEVLNSPGPALIRIGLIEEEMVFPMVAPGGANTKMITKIPVQ